MSELFPSDRLSVFVAMLLLCGCNVPESVSRDSQSELAPKIRYMKDAFGICYAVIGSRTYTGYVVNSITNVPCERVGL